MLVLMLEMVVGGWNKDAGRVAQLHAALVIIRYARDPQMIQCGNETENKIPTILRNNLQVYSIEVNRCTTPPPNNLGQQKKRYLCALTRVNSSTHYATNSHLTKMSGKERRSRLPIMLIQRL